MNYINPTTREIVSFAELRTRYPEVSLPRGVDIIQLGADTWALLREDPRPEINDYQIIVAGNPILRSNQWRYTWDVQPKPVEDRLALAEFAVQRALDAQAIALGFDGITDAASYVADPHPEWAAQAQALVAWRSDVWRAYEAIAAGARQGKGLPLPQQIVVALPTFEIEAGT